MSTPAGWYDDGHGQQRWWDGGQWTEELSGQLDVREEKSGLLGGLAGRIKDATSQAVAETRDNMSSAGRAIRAESRDVEAPPAVPDETPLFEVVSHIQGKNAKVRLFTDRIEWERARGVSGGKIAAGIMTGGLTLLATGVKGSKDAYEMLPLNMVTSVSNRKDGMIYHVVDVQTAGGTVGFRVSRDDAARFRQAILNQMQVRASAPVVVQTVAAAPVVIAAETPAAPVDHIAQLQQLATLRDAGVLTDAEFDAKKAEILARM